MSRKPSALPRRAAALKRDFDRGFAEPLRPPAPQTFDLLALRLGGQSWAIPLADAAGLHSGKRIAPVPSPFPAFLGVAGFRGTLVSVYDLSALTSSGGLTEPRWLLLAAERRVAFAFAELEGHLRVEAADMLPLGPEDGGPWTRGLVRAGGATRPILDLSALLGAIPRRQAPAMEGKDR